MPSPARPVAAVRSLGPWAVALVVLAGLAASVVAAALSGAVAAPPGGLSDAGPVVRWALPLVRLVHDVAAALLVSATARVVHEDLAHDSRAHAEEMRAVLEVRPFPVDQPHVRFVDQGVRLQGVIGTFAHHLAMRETQQLVVHHRPQLVVNAVVAVAPGLQQRRDIRRVIHGGLSGSLARGFRDGLDYSRNLTIRCAKLCPHQLRAAEL